MDVQELTDLSHSSSARDGRAAVDKAMSLLTSFGREAHSGVGVSELARRSGLSKSTAHRILGMLERNHAVERVGSDYRLGAELHNLGERVYAPHHSVIRDVLTPYLADLYEATRQTVHLAVLHGPDVLYINKLYGHRHVASPSRVGGRSPAHCTAVGKALLAYSNEDIEGLLGRDLVARTERTVTDAVRLRAELGQVRRTGVAFDREETRDGLVCIGGAVAGPGLRVAAAFSVSGPVSSFSPASVEPALRRVSLAASRALCAAHSALAS
ncbi:IclR family transcriptional regulator [Rhodococcus sp. ABRD24]|uniref:IclR family transcriptional regulator n=1 Tax=Rhodococcus sp. ABRD24 TaxID=2507582 RepID=UPI00103A4534|nr:IclR family transcriptional regulator [Rhodococcus sp. ABRD24]QBJ95487.1 IclR family transcriptional regulator [Rhodococcus sp. ABRD24]